DFQNFKRRVEKERMDWMTSAQANVLKKLLPVFDELDNVVNLVQEQQAQEATAWGKGLELSQKNWQKTLQELGVEEISTSGMFDPELHEGLMQEETQDKQAGEIIRTFSKGYRFKGNVIRHAKVSVAK
ncbi:nucleotide exchange factor GrpE, partial [Candidatus Dependentiae bacterium]|nr:nucleotide exchange factor GrpE [Candidatus Dependentiae bacterium]